MPARSRTIPVGTTRISPRAKRYVAQVLASEWLSEGAFTRRFEAMVAKAHRVRWALFCNSGTSALQCTIAAMKERNAWQDGDEVVVPAVTFVASVNAVLVNGLKPVLADVDPHTYNLDPAQIDAKLTRRTRAILAAHLFGQPCEMDAIMTCARRSHLHVVEDSCETMFARYRGRPVGSFGAAVCFSTRASHLISTGIGGFACTNDERLARIIKSLFNDGRRPVRRGARARATGRATFERVGFSFRASELEAALGLAQMEERRAMLAARRRNAALLTELLTPIADRIQLPSWPAHSEHVFAMYPMVVRSESTGKADLIAFLEARGIETRDLLPIVSQPAYARRFARFAPELPVAGWLDRCGFYVGCHEGLTESAVAAVGRAIVAFFARRGARGRAPRSRPRVAIGRRD